MFLSGDYKRNNIKTRQKLVNNRTQKDKWWKSDWQEWFTFLFRVLIKRQRKKSGRRKIIENSYKKAEGLYQKK
jgi:hypothetical protein